MNKSPLKENFGTLLETKNGLIKLGYNHDFNIQEECLVCHQTYIALSPNEFQIDKVYLFDEEANTDDESILYAISSEKFNIRGTLVNGYGISSNEANSRLIEKLQTHTPPNPHNTKSNDATVLRPDGNRVLNAPLLEMDLYKFMEQIKNETTWAESDRNSITIFKSETMRIVLIGLHENAELKAHKANGVISVQVLEGKINFTTEEESCVIEKGQMIALQENIIHSTKALTESFILLTLSMNKI